MASEDEVQVMPGRPLKQDDLWDQVGPLGRKQGPEGRLMLAVLKDALDCLERHRFSTKDFQRRLFHDARRWILSVGAAGPFSFEFICGVLGLDANAVRRGLRTRASMQRALPSRIPTAPGGISRTVPSGAAGAPPC
jgi:hypothetical protein